MMHSHDVQSGPTVGIHRPGHPTHPEPEPAMRDSSSKILQSLLYNFAQSNYLNNNHNVHQMEDRDMNNESLPRGNQSSLESVHPISRDISRHRSYPPERSPSHMRYRHTTPFHHSPQAAYEPYPSSSRHYPMPSATVTSQSRSRDGVPLYTDNYLSLRQRSSSIGSAGSSFRDSRSPSHDSTTSHDSLSRCSPMSINSSPSPSPPTPPENGSKLFGILKGGAYNYPYGLLPNRNSPKSGHHNSATTHNNNQNRNHYYPSSASDSSSGSPIQFPHRVDPYAERDILKSRLELGVSQSVSNFSPALRQHKRDISSCQDEPIDLSCKAKKHCQESSQPCKDLSMVDTSRDWGSNYYIGRSPSTTSIDYAVDDSPRKSILESILCGRAPSRNEPSFRNSPVPKTETPILEKSDSFSKPAEDDRSPSRHNWSVSVPCSPVQTPELPSRVPSISASTPPSPAQSMGRPFGVAPFKVQCPWRQRVTLAKKNLLPVSARVSDWLNKIVDFAKSLPEFASLPDSDKKTLIQQCWTRLMLLYMAETNFQFAVTPVHGEMDDGHPTAISGIDPSEPTMDSVEMVQNYIRKCQTLLLDQQEYRCLRIVTLFHPGCTDLENVGFVENISSQARQCLQGHVRNSRPDEKLRYSNILLCLHTLFGANCGMVQTLFCTHISKDRGDIETYLGDLVLKPDSVADDESDDETEKLYSKHDDVIRADSPE